MLAALCLLATGTLARTQWVLTFSDEFNGPANSAADPAKWGYDVGGGGFGNHELESYTAGNKNAFLDGQGHLVIEARKEPTTGQDGIPRDYSSARLKTAGMFSQTYGKFEVRVKEPIGSGFWPAFWVLGDNIGSVGWPRCGELDIMEYRGQHARSQVGTAHGPGYSGNNGKSGSTEIDKGTLADDFHVYGIEWEPKKITWFLDGKPYHSLTPDDLQGKKWVYDHPFFVILNMAIGGDYGGPLDETTTFPQRLVVDWVRVYKAKS